MTYLLYLYIIYYSRKQNRFASHRRIRTRLVTPGPGSVSIWSNPIQGKHVQTNRSRDTLHRIHHLRSQSDCQSIAHFSQIQNQMSWNQKRNRGRCRFRNGCKEIFLLPVRKTWRWPRHFFPGIHGQTIQRCRVQWSCWWGARVCQNAIWVSPDFDFRTFRLKTRCDGRRGMMDDMASFKRHARIKIIYSLEYMTWKELLLDLQSIKEMSFVLCIIMFNASMCALSSYCFYLFTFVQSAVLSALCSVFNPDFLPMFLLDFKNK